MQSSVLGFNQAIVKSNQWLKELKQIGDLQSEEEAYIVLCAVLHALRDRLFTTEAVLLSSEMPFLIRGMYFEGWNPGRTPNSQAFLTAVSDNLGNAAFLIDSREAVNAVFRFLKNKIAAGELENIKDELPEEILTLWKDTEKV